MFGKKTNHTLVGSVLAVRISPRSPELFIMEDIGKCYQKGNKTRFGLKAGGIVSLIVAGFGSS